MIYSTIYFLQSEIALSWFERALQQSAGSFAFIFAIIITIIAGSCFVTKFITKHNIQSQHDRDKVNGVETHIDTIKQDIAFIKGTLTFLSSRSPDSPSPTQSRSPVSLSDFGKELAKRMNLEEKVSRNWEKIYTFLDLNIQSRNAYDIQQFCIETASVSLENFFSPADVEDIKTFAFNEGKPLVYYGGMIGVLIRDAYFKHKGINVAEVDKFDPTK